MKRSCVLWCCISVVGCGTIIDYENEATRICLTPPRAAVMQGTEPVYAYEQGDMLMVKAYSDACYATGCGEVHDASCDVEVVDSTIRITTRFSIWQREGGNCKSDCRYAEANCQTPALAEQSYTVEFGEALVVFDVPSTRAQLCLQQ